MQTFVRIALGVILFSCGVAYAAGDQVTREDVVQLVHKAMAEMKKDGNAAAFAKFDDLNNKAFHPKGLYVFVHSMTAKTLAHGENKRVVGINLINMKDVDGKLYMQERIAMAKAKGKGWQTYKYYNPQSHKIEKKLTYFEVYNNMMVGSGMYGGNSAP